MREMCTDPHPPFDSSVENRMKGRQDERQGDGGQFKEVAMKIPIKIYGRMKREDQVFLRMLRK